tara:strand:+ start:505 stop:921 length:417 start_codon:yes stop_codon:yes gene_type:complete
MRTINDYSKEIQVLGAPVEVKIRIKVEEDNDGRDLLLDCDLGPEREEALKDYNEGRLEVLNVYVLVETDLFKGVDMIGGVFVRSEKDIHEAVNDYCLVEEAIDDFIANVKEARRFLSILKCKALPKKQKGKKNENNND